MFAGYKTKALSIICLPQIRILHNKFTHTYTLSTTFFLIDFFLSLLFPIFLMLSNYLFTFVTFLLFLLHISIIVFIVLIGISIVSFSFFFFILLACLLFVFFCICLLRLGSFRFYL